MIGTVLLSAAAGVIAVVLFVPISVRANGGAGEDELWGVVELRWGYGIAMVRVGFEAAGRFYLFGIPLFRTSAFFKPSDERKKRKKRKFPKPSHLFGDDRRVFVRMVARGLSALHPQFHIGGTVGLGDPAYTGLMLTAARRIDRLVTDRIEVDFRDDFLEDTTQLYGRMRAWMIPAEVALILLVWIARPDTRRVLRGK